jgi:16S rRNA (cytidine1402-2'-O)-methyltransferase
MRLCCKAARRSKPAGPRRQRRIGYVAAVSDTAGILYVVATPIGNLADLGTRAADTLKQVDVVLAEDTRVTRRLLDAYAISTPLESVHDHNEERVSSALVGRLAAGARMALVSDAGTPLLSDPGYRLIRLAQDHGIAVQVVPGPSAITAALSVSGLPARPFWFEGFLPARAGARRERLRALAAIEGTLVFFEAPHRVCEAVHDLAAVLGPQREAAFARELSKRFEEVVREPLADLAVRLSATTPRGEFVLLVAGAQGTATGEQELARVLGCLLDVLPMREAAAVAARITGARRNDAYALALRLRGTGALEQGDCGDTADDTR